MSKSTIIDRRRPASGIVMRSGGEQTLLFVTVCTASRAPWLACDFVHDQLRRIWRDSDAWLVGSYVIMPDHMHFFCAPHDREISVDRWLQYWKSQFTKSHQREDWRWLPRAFHHRIRNADSMKEKYYYMVQNPVRAGLVKEAEEWRFRGWIHEIR
jgi:putative transposase